MADIQGVSDVAQGYGLPVERGSVELMRELIDVAEGRVAADLVFVNAQIVDVYQLRVARGQVAVKRGCIAGVLFEGRDCEGAAVPAWDAARVVDCEGRYLAPGFIDGHLHIESSNIRPSEYARMALARGTTTAIAMATLSRRTFSGSTTGSRRRTSVAAPWLRESALTC